MALRYCGWTESNLKPRLKPLLVGIYRGIILPGFLGGAGLRPSTVGLFEFNPLQTGW